MRCIRVKKGIVPSPISVVNSHQRRDGGLVPAVRTLAVELGPVVGYSKARELFNLSLPAGVRLHLQVLNLSAGLAGKVIVQVMVAIPTGCLIPQRELLDESLVP
jgi:hypothetical protein